jgi:hypothetical protein
VDLAWKEGRLARVRLASDAGGDYVLVHGKQSANVTLRAGEAAEFGLRKARLVRL